MKMEISVPGQSKCFKLQHVLHTDKYWHSIKKKKKKKNALAFTVVLKNCRGKLLISLRKGTFSKEQILQLCQLLISNAVALSC